MDASSLFRTLREDHARVLVDLDALEPLIGRSPDATRSAATPPGSAIRLAEAVVDRVRAFAAHLREQFATHLVAEDEVLYPALASGLSDGPALLAPLHAEHRELREMLSALDRTLSDPGTAARDEQIVVQVRDLVDLLRIHIRKEEALLFGVAERVMGPSDLREIEARRTGANVPRVAGGAPTTHPKGTP